MAAASDAQSGTDGTDRDRTDMMFDHAQDPFTGAVTTIGTGTTKFDYFCWQDSLSTQRMAFVFNTATVPAGGMPAELATYVGGAAGASAKASDHRPVIADFVLMPALPCNSAATNLGFAKAGANAIYPRFSACGALSSGHTASLTLQDAPPNTLAYPILSFTSGMMNAFGGTIIPNPPILADPIPTDANGQIVIPAIPGGGGPITVYFQWGIVDPGAPQGVSFSNALRLDWLP
jgi:hypothetical protein